MTDESLEQRKLHSLLMRIQNGTATLKNSQAGSYKMKHILYYIHQFTCIYMYYSIHQFLSSVLITDLCPHTYTNCEQKYIAVTKSWKQSRSPPVG